MQLIILCISLALLIVYAALLIYYRAAWSAIPGYQPEPSTSNLQPSTSISVIVPARNEAPNLPALLNSLNSQSYPKHLFDVIVVDDHSTDETASIVSNCKNGNIKLIRLQDIIDGANLNSYKKKAIEVAVAATKAALIVTTDADCVVPANWLSAIAAYYEAHKPSLIVMPVSYREKPNFLEIFQSLDFMTLQGITGASVHKRMLSMCNGANLAYTRQAFEAVEGFKGISDLASGDDMLLMHKIYKWHPQGIGYIKSTDVIVQTAPMHSWNDFFNQRIRWASKADKYDDKRIFWVLLLVYLLNLWLLLLPAIAMLCSKYSLFNTWLLMLAAKTIVELIFLLPVAAFFGKQKLLYYFPFMQPFHIVYTVIAGWLGKFGSYRWKERKVK